MTYFHPWTLRVSDATEHVPYAGHLRKSTETWQDALALWLEGNILCEEARRYVGASSLFIACDQWMTRPHAQTTAMTFSATKT